MSENETEQLSLEQKITIWERAIETQMHFAELSIKMRQIGLTLAGATIALAIVLYRTESNFSFEILGIGISIPIASVLCISAAAILFAAAIIDVGVYHRMLRGAVTFNEMYEQQLDAAIGWESGLTEAISAFSRLRDPEPQPKRDKGGKKWTGQKKSNASARIVWFYTISVFALLTAAFGLWWVENTDAVVVR